MSIKNRAFVICVMFMAAGLCLMSCGPSKGRKAKHSRYYIKSHDLQHVPGFDMPVEVNDRVVAWMEYFQGPGRGHFRRYMERSGRYVPLMQKILREEGMPQDLIYLALIESGFNTQAYSRASAAGPWQFIQSTGKRYGLRVDGFVDERRDPYKSTKAALEYLKDLYQEFGDWYLAMSAYNAGEGRIRDAISMTGSRNFWDLAENKRALRAETRDYVPKFIAAAMIAKMPERFGFDNIDFREPFDFDKAEVDSQTDLSVIAKCAGTSEDAIFDLNPHLIRGATPPGSFDYEIRVPKGTGKKFAEQYAMVPKEERIQVARYQVRRGDTLARVARRYGVSASALADANGIRSTRGRLSAGSTLIIPTGRASRYASHSAEAQTVHIVKRGETMAKIAGRYGVKPKQLMVWNGIKSAKNIHAGTRLIVSKVRPERVAQANVSEEETVSSGKSAAVGAAGKTHTVRKGETLDTIARRYGVTTKQLLALNNLGNPKLIRAGTKITIRAGEAEPAGRPVLLADAGKQMKSAPIASESRIHKVQTGETLGTIARRYGITTKELMTLNNIKDPKKIRAGMELVLGGKSVKKAELPVVNTSPVQTNAVPEPLSSLINSKETDGPVKLDSVETKSPAGEDEALVYKVKNGDTLWDIARRHKVTIAKIQKWNNLSDPSAVKPGTSLKIKKD